MRDGFSGGVLQGFLLAGICSQVWNGVGRVLGHQHRRRRDAGDLRSARKLRVPSGICSRLDGQVYGKESDDRKCVDQDSTDHVRAFLARDAMLARCMLWPCVRPSVRPSICLSQVAVLYQKG